MTKHHPYVYPSYYWLGLAWINFFDEDLHNHLKVCKKGYFIQASHNNHAASTANGFPRDNHWEDVLMVLYPTINQLIVQL